MPKPTPQQTLEDAVAIAMGNGWEKGDLGLVFTMYTIPEILRRNRYFMIIFSQGFAKALWGEKYPNHYRDQMPWQFHLQQMVLAANPLTYLAENLPA